MDEFANEDGGAPVQAALPLIELGKWMGRRDAFGQMAGRCSAAEMESLRQIHDSKLYQNVNCTWEEFCARYLVVSARTVERELANLRRFGPAYFTVRQLMRISPREYAAIADCITEHGVSVNGEVVALDPENSDEVAGAIQTLLEQNGPSEPAPVTPKSLTFETAMQRFRAASETLRSFRDELDHGQAHALGMELTKLLSAALVWGVEVGIE